MQFLWILLYEIISIRGWEREREQHEIPWILENKYYPDP